MKKRTQAIEVDSLSDSPTWTETGIRVSLQLYVVAVDINAQYGQKD